MHQQVFHSHDERRRPKGRRLLRSTFAALVVAALATNTACGTNAAGGESSTAVDKDAAATLARLYKGTIEQPPRTGPKAVAGKDVWVISCGQVAISCVGGANGAMDAGHAVGWDMHLYDGKLNPALYSAGIDQAVAAGADGIILDAVSCNAVQAAASRAKAKGVKMIVFYGFDCDDPTVGAQPLFDGVVKFSTGESNTWYEDWGRAQAEYAIARTAGNVNIVTIDEQDLTNVHYIREGILAAVKACGSRCKIVADVPVAFPDLGTKLQGKIQTALLQHPEANVLLAQYDGAVLAGIGPAVRASGRKDESLLVVGGEGFAPNADLVRGHTGEQDAGNGVASDWAGWAAIDSLNRVFADQPLVREGIGWQIYDADHNLPASGAWVSTVDGNVVDYKSAYKKIWGR